MKMELKKLDDGVSVSIYDGDKKLNVPYEFIRGHFSEMTIAYWNHYGFDIVKEYEMQQREEEVLKIIDPEHREWTYDGNGNKVYKDNYTKAWTEEKEQKNSSQ